MASSPATIPHQKSPRSLDHQARAKKHVNSAWGTFLGLLDRNVGVFGQLVVSRLFRQENILTQVYGNNHLVLKVAPPLAASEEQIDMFVAAVEELKDEIHSGSAFWKEGLGLARRGLHI